MPSLLEERAAEQPSSEQSREARRGFLGRCVRTAIGLSAAAVGVGAAMRPRQAEASPAAFAAFAWRAFASFLGGLAARFAWTQIVSQWIDQRTQRAQIVCRCYNVRTRQWEVWVCECQGSNSRTYRTR